MFAELAVDLHDSNGVNKTVDMVVRFALDALDRTYAGVVFAVGGGRAEIAAVTQPLTDIYLGQIRVGEGPLVTALTC
jgi:hypothetical protein